MSEPHLSRPADAAPADPTPGAVERPDVRSPSAPPDPAAALSIRGLWKRFGQKTAVAGIDLDVPRGSFYGFVGPNGAGKTTTLSMATGLLRPDAGTVMVNGTDFWSAPDSGKAQMGVLPDGVRLFDRLTGAQLLTYSGLLRGMDRDVVAERADDLLRAMDLTEDKDTFVVDYSAGMTKKIALGCALIHAPRVLVLDEPFEAVDPVSAANIRDMLADYVRSGATVIVSSHVMDLVQRMCSHVAVIADGQIRAAGTVDDVRAGGSLEDRFVELVGGRHQTEGLAWLRTSSDSD
ncbi:ABC transporter ATP-binding protein [Ruania rhizosphaerae]|uniref:ABC transporter ATP-binding protein n=1 Tax=Ruania rhizosphaerae TaxID=1840413 RepID=UPI00190F8803|nr:ABC transporter ATP-binding protein [Ruania rhizosphaerae]